jgi:hypothetical protein
LRGAAGMQSGTSVLRGCRPLWQRCDDLAIEVF